MFQMRSGYGRSIFGPLLPLILGRDISGEVAAVGASVRGLTVGQEVFGALHPTAVRGTYADYAILSEDELAPKPASVTHVVNICVLLLRLLVNKGRLSGCVVAFHQFGWLHIFSNSPSP